MATELKTCTGGFEADRMHQQITFIGDSKFIARDLCPLCAALHDKRTAMDEAMEARAQVVRMEKDKAQS